MNNNNDQVIIISDFIEEEPYSPQHQDPNNKASIWIHNAGITRPSTDVTILKKLEPGVYTADYDRDNGYFCRKLKFDSDELFVFSNSITESLLKEIQTFWSKGDLYLQHRLVHKRGILLEGFPGTGKSSLVTQLSEAVIAQGGVVFKVQNFRNLNDYVNFMRFGFKKIEPTTPIITILEDIDQYEEVETDLLDFLDGKSSLNHHVVIATTNNTSKIPDTFLRPSRFDHRIEVPLPEEQIRREYFQFKKVDEKFIEELVSETDGCSLADLKEIYVCVFLLDYSINDAIKKVTTFKSKKNYLTTPKKSGKIGL